MISWRVSLSKRWSARRRCLAVLDFITTWGHRGLPKWRRSKKGVEWWDNFPLGERQGAAVGPSPGWRLTYCCPRHSLICAWRALGRARECQHACPRLGPAGQWEAAARVSGVAAVTPGRTRLPVGQQEDWACVGALCQASCEALGPAMAVERRLLAAWHPEGWHLWPWLFGAAPGGL